MPPSGARETCGPTPPDTLTEFREYSLAVYLVAAYNQLELLHEERLEHGLVGIQCSHLEKAPFQYVVVPVRKASSHIVHLYYYRGSRSTYTESLNGRDQCTEYRLNKNV